MTEPTTPEKQNPPATPDEKTREVGANNTSPPEREGFFKRVRRGLHEPIHPSEEKEIVVDPDES
jgi:hypothetical protein